MAQKSCSDDQFVELFESVGASEAAKVLGISERAIYHRRKHLEKKLDRPMTPKTKWESDYPMRIPMDIQDGIVIVGSDCHYYPGISSPAHRGYVKLAKELQPYATILDGDVFDFAKISRHAPIGWTKKPSVNEEREVVEERTSEIQAAAPHAKRYWLLGNHCMRFENYLANSAGAFQGTPGFRLRDHFAAWNFGISLWINDDVVVKHRFKGGIHATHNNTMWSGKSMVTGHLHSLKVTPFSDYHGTRYGVDTGTMADPYGSHADYTEDNPLNHRSGFIVLTFHKGMMLWPEIVSVVNESAIQFRGQVIPV